MTTVSIEFDATDASRLFDRKARFAGDFMKRAGREMLGVVQKDIKGEIRGQYYLAGGKKKWAPTVGLGRLAAGRPALRSFGRKWAAAKPQVTTDAAELRVSVPAAGVHVGGSGATRSERTTTIRARGNPRAMQAAIFRRTGGLVSRRTLTGPGLKVPARPHANPDNPTTALGVEVVMARRFEGA